ncbi:phosphotransferase enzyme family protein [Kribbella soli]|uniref:phosphotransferase enzyme family protein n=1 Tax=Kribbella soli TaxID=1124743 RepID=UPI0013F49014|nr:phosphotransferase [Kribbella soli]
MDSLLRHWGLQGYAVRPLTEGTNNTGYYVGDEFVLRIHRNAIAPTYEHAVLRSLSGLSFAVPVPVPVDGETTVRGELHGETVLASLSRRIPGEHPVRGDSGRVEACGRALAELDHALGRLDQAELPPPRVWDGDLTNVHPRVPSIDRVIDGVAAEDRDDVARILTGIGPRPDLPRQIIHGDFAMTNVLMAGDRVAAILDFETAGPGYRAMDLAVGRFFFGEVGHPSEAFQRGYLDAFPLTDAELSAIRELELMREATSLVHWYGRYVDGQITAENLADRVERLRRVEDWASER